ncbi:hypothetical protein [Paludisphaera mucosa]|uniref:Uncharacterized protein n=1 Tax=Paludisphaera mucosa TaxID=3030827 RepID=A0ABT6FDW8_9BACT|nr:hypothetical protein [Paludisphaera mucosa]MDG3005744.1 hypothetical protein [Paludisphaera mucosa]
MIILQGVADAAEFWKKLDAPDWIVSRPAAGRVAGDESGPAGASGAIVDSVHVKGVVEGEDARITLVVDCALTAPGPVWAPLRIDAPVVLAAREGDRELQLRKGAGNLWEARLEGAREHHLRIEATVPVRIGAERRTLELAIPEAPATSFDLVLPRRAYDVDLGTGEAAVRPTPVEGGEGVRIAAHVRPRSPLVVSWSEQDAAGPRAAPLLSAQLEMAVEVDAEGVVVRSSWAIACARGVARSLQIRLEDDEVVSRLQLNDQFPGSGIERAGGGSLLTIPLAEPIRSGESRRLVLETRRPSSGGKVLNFSGYPLTDAGEQSGFLGAAHGSNLFVNVLKSQGLRRIDPRDLPTALKTRLAGTTIALQFLDQPFALVLGVESSPPLFQADASARLFFEPDGVRNETTLNVERVRGSLFEIEVAVPPDLKVVSVGPPDLVEAATPPQAEAAAPGGPDPAGSARILKIRLTPQARDRPTFSLKLSGRQPAPGPGDVRLGLFAPRGAVTTNASFALFAGRELSLEPIDASLVKDASAEPSAAKSEADPSAPSLRLRSGRNPATLDVRLERRPLEIRRDTRLAARVSRRTVEVRQETKVRVRHGAVSSLTVLAPEGVSTHWEVSDGKQPIRKEDLEAPTAGVRRSRLLFDRPVVDATLTFRYRVPLGRALDPGGATVVRIPWLAVEAGSTGGCLVELASDPDVEVAVDDPAWTRVDSAAADARASRSYRLDRDDAAEALTASARLVETVPLPPVVASRAFIRSTLDAEGNLRVSAWYAIEAHPTSLSVALPAGASWLRARVDGRAVERIDVGPDGTTSRIDLPAESAGRAVLVELEYRTPAAAARRPWAPPALLDGAEVLQAYWLVQVPWTQAVAGPPAGWADENRWVWDVYAWTRRPVAASARLIAWAAGPSPPPVALDDALDADEAARGFLFSRAGPPSPMNPWIVSRTWAVLGCSGLALIAALGLTYFPAAAPWILGAAAVAGLPAAMLLPSDVLGLGVQSASFGLFMGLIVYAGRRIAIREAAAAAVSARTPTGSNVVVSESSQRSSPGVGSDDSTAIRVRTTSTMDYLSPQPGAVPDAPLSSRLQRGLRPE